MEDMVDADQHSLRPCGTTEAETEERLLSHLITPINLFYMDELDGLSLERRNMAWMRGRR